VKIETGSKVVVDASAVGAIFFQEPEAALIEKRLANRIWVAPALLDYEIGSIYLKKLKLYPKLRPQLESCLRVFFETQIERVEISIASVIPVAEKFGLTIYDASYFWLAGALDIDLFTLDKALLSAWAKR
jgi:predicted nucleic acid-binding protein